MCPVGDRIDVFEQAGDIDTVLFDKTGTLTTGVMRLAGLVTDEDPERFLRLVGSIEAASGHPLGKAVALAADERDVELAVPESLETVTGAGVSAADLPSEGAASARRSFRASPVVIGDAASGTAPSAKLCRADDEPI